MHFKETQYGFEFDSVSIKRFCSEQKGVITIGTTKNSLIGNSTSINCSIKVKD